MQIAPAIAVSDIAADEKQGTGAKIATSGAITANRCAQWDADGTLASAPEACGTVDSSSMSSVDGEIALFSGTDGKQIKRASGTGFVKTTEGVFGTAATISAGDIAATDKQGDGSKLVTSGTVTPSRCAEWDGNGKLVSATGACGSSTRVEWEWYPISSLSVSQVATSGWVNPSSGGPTYNSAGAATRVLWAEFSDSSTVTLNLVTRVPSNWDGSTAPDIKLYSAASANLTPNLNYRIVVGAGCTATNDDIASPVITDAPAILITAATGGASRRQNATGTVPGLPMTGCAPGSSIIFNVKRDPAHAQDDTGLPWLFRGAEIKWTVTN
jgi:hypothetical protein